MKRIWVSLLFLIPLLAYSFTAEEVALNAAKKLSSLQSLEANFEHFYYSMSLATPLKEKGKFYFKKPGWMRWDYKVPDEMTYVIKEGKFLAYFPEDNQLLRSSLSKEEYESEILGFLSGQAKFKENYLIEWSPFPSEEGSVFQLKLTPKVEREFTHILLEISQKTWLIQKAIFLDWSGNKQEYRFTQIRTNPRLAADQFEIKVPPDCEIIDGRFADKSNESLAAPRRSA